MNRLAAPSVDVVVPVFNRLPLLRQTVADLRSQDHMDCRFILVDDRSDEDTYRFLQELSSDPRFQVITKPIDQARGCQASRNLGLQHSHAEFVMFLDSDDLLESDCLSSRSGFAASHPGTDIIVGNQAILRETDKSNVWVNEYREDENDIDRFLNLAHPVDVPWVNAGCLLRRDFLIEHQIEWDSRYFWDDMLFHVNCLWHGARVLWQPRSSRPDAWYRQHGGEHFGSKLHTPEGITNTQNLLLHIRQQLHERALLSQRRLSLLQKNYFHLVILRRIDLQEVQAANESITTAYRCGIFSAVQTTLLRAFNRIRASLRHSRRGTFYCNQMARRFTLKALFVSGKSTYACLPCASNRPITYEDERSAPATLAS